MDEVTVRIPKRQMQFYLELMQRHGFQISQADESEIPAMHIKAIRHRDK